MVRAIARAYAEELSAISNYIYADILLKKALPAVAGLFATISMDEMHHHHALGALLRDLGVNFALSTAVRNTSYRLNEDEDSHAVVVARRILADRGHEEQQAAKNYKRLAEAAKTEAARSLLSGLAADEENHAMALANMEKRLAFS